jgi:hypothetical protein
VLFQPIDDKTQCVGVYTDGNLIFDENKIPKNLTKTWRYTGSLREKDIQYANIYAQGAPIEEICPEHLKDEWESAAKKMRAYKKSFDIAKINLREHCFFDLVPHDALVRFCEIKNQITEHVFENYEKPANYEYMASAAKLLHRIKYQDLKVDASECRNLFINGGMRNESQKILNGSKHVHYNLFGTVTGRLSTHPQSFPMLTMKRELRRLVKPHNDWFLSLDYNGAEVRTLLALSEQKQPNGDIHEWNITNVFQNTGMNREEAKTSFFAWLYNPDSDHIKTNYYDRKKVLDRYYDGEYINTVFGRHIKVSNWKAFNYLIQSTTADLVIDRAVAIERMLEGKKSFISHIVHDEIVIDFADQERDMVGQIRDMFAKNKLDTFKVNLKAGKNYYDLENLSL